MTKLNEMAKAYVPQTTKNIAELQKVSVDVDVFEEERTDDEGKLFKIWVATIDGNKYRIPVSVLDGLKGILAKLPETKYFQVLKSGSGMNTKYQVIPLI